MDIRKIDGPMGVWKAEENAGSRKSVAPSRGRSKDRVEISPDGAQARASEASVARLATATREVRDERVEEVRGKVEELTARFPVYR